MMFIQSEPTWLSFLPAIAAIVLAIYTRRIMISLLAGIIAGSGVLIYLTGNWQYLNIFKYFFYPALYTTTFRDLIIIYVICLGVLLGLWNKTRGDEHFSTTLGEKIATGPRSAMFFGWLIGLVFHQGGTISTILAGTTLKPITDQHRISHEELAYLVDSTASPIATLIPLNAWPIYVSNVIAGIIPILPDKDAAYHFLSPLYPIIFMLYWLYWGLYYLV
jgi:Na+/H+ antiporter NhaC